MPLAAVRAVLPNQFRNLQPSKMLFYQSLIWRVLEKSLEFVHKVVEKLVYVHLLIQIYRIAIEVLNSTGEGLGIYVLLIAALQRGEQVLQLVQQIILVGLCVRGQNSVAEGAKHKNLLQ